MYRRFQNRRTVQAKFAPITVYHYEEVPPFSSVCPSTHKFESSPSFLRTFSESSPNFFSAIAIELFLNNSPRNILSKQSFQPNLLIAALHASVCQQITFLAGLHQDMLLRIRKKFPQCRQE